MVHVGVDVYKVPYEVPHSNQRVAYEPFGSTKPFKFAEFSVIFDAGYVVTFGKLKLQFTHELDVVKLRVFPYTTCPFDPRATALK
jgi:hypothetical protein